LNWRDHVEIDKTFRRPSDIRISRADPSRAAEVLGWQATLKMNDVAKRMVETERGQVDLI